MDLIRVVSLFLTIIIVSSVAFVSKRPEIMYLRARAQSYKHADFFGAHYTSQRALISSVSFNSGSFSVNPLDNDHKTFAFSSLFRIPEFKPRVIYSPKSPTGNLGIALKPIQRLGFVSRSHWRLGLSKSLVHELGILSKTSHIDLNLSGLPLSKFWLRSGASTINVFFNELNPVSLTSFEIESGTSDCRINQLMNANAKAINISGSGSCTLDFNGAGSQDCVVTIREKLGKVHLMVPSNLNVRLYFLDSIKTIADISGFTKISETEYRHFSGKTANPDVKIFIQISAGQLKVEKTNERINHE